MPAVLVYAFLGLSPLCVVSVPAIEWLRDARRSAAALRIEQAIRATHIVCVPLVMVVAALFRLAAHAAS